MSYNTKDVVFENKTHWILKTDSFYEIYKKQCTHSLRVGKVSLKLGLDRAIKNLEILHIRKEVL